MSSPLLKISSLNAWHGSRQVLSRVNISVGAGKILAVIGPMGAGKSTLLRCVNRLYEHIPETSLSGKIELQGKDIYQPDIDILQLRKKVGMIFSEPTVFSHLSIFENVALGLRLGGVKSGAEIGEAVEKALARVNLWQALKDLIHSSPTKLSVGNRQRLCLARALVLKPKILLMDEPTSNMEQHAGARFEQVLRNVGDKTTIIFATSSRKQAARVSDQTAFLLDGELIEIGKTSDLFMNPQDSRTEDYLTGRFG